jgi:hypothetical protein
MKKLPIVLALVLVAGVVAMLFFEARKNHSTSCKG